VKRQLLLQLLAEALAGSLPADDPRLAGVELELQPVAGGVHVLRGAGANVGALCTPEGCLLVDDAFAPLVPRLLALLRGLPGGGRVRWVVDTHWHLDHAGGNAALAAEATIVAHASARRRLEAWRAGLAAPAAGDGLLPAVTFDGALTLRLGGEEVRLLHLGPGHTDGDVAVHFVRAGVLQLGDLFVTYGLPFVDAASGGSVAGVARTLRRLLSEVPEDARIIPGHGPVSSCADVLAFAAVLEDCLDGVRGAHRRGWTLDEMVARGALGRHARLAGPFVGARDFLATLQREVEAELRG
jgi:cyclase